MGERLEVHGLLLLAVLLSSACSDDGDRGVRILPLGDSITQGDDTHQSYRYPLWTMLVDGGYDFDFVGSKNGNYQGNPPWPEHAGREFDRHHEGHWGFHAHEILEGLPLWLETYTPEIVLMHLGTNDAFAYQPAPDIADEIGEVIEVLRDDNPQVVILLARLIPTTWPDANDIIEELNQEIVTLADEHYDPESPIVVVDQADGFDAALDTHDGIHPTATGEQKLAARWLAALEPYL